MFVTLIASIVCRVADDLDLAQLSRYLTYDQDTLVRLVGVSQLPADERPAATVVAIDPNDADALASDGFLPDGVPSARDLYGRGRRAIDSWLASNEAFLREQICPRWDTVRENSQITDIAPPAVALLAQIIGVAEPVTGSLVLLAALTKHELNEFCGKS